MAIKPIEDSSLTQSEKDDVVLAIVKEGGIFSKAPPTEIKEMKDFIEKYKDEVKDLFDSYTGTESDKISTTKSNNIREIPNINEFFYQVIVPAVESLHSEGKLKEEEKTNDINDHEPLPKPLTAAYKSYQSYGPKNSTATPISPKSITGQVR